MLRRLARTLAGMVPTGLVLPILRGPLRGRWWVAGAAAGEGKGLSSLLFPVEWREMACAYTLAPSGGIALDIGANVGQYSLLLSRVCERVFAFEPLPRNLHFLHRTLEVNRVDNVTIVPCAVGEKLTLGAIRTAENSALATLDDDGAQPAAIMSCDEFVAQYGAVPSLIKVDVEGAEVNVLKGAAELLREHRPVVLLSTHSPKLESECIALMEEAGYPRPLRLANDQRSGGASLLWPSAPVSQRTPRWAATE